VVLFEGVREHQHHLVGPSLGELRGSERRQELGDRTDLHDMGEHPGVLQGSAEVG
jgi:hypothetical protein